MAEAAMAGAGSSSRPAGSLRTSPCHRHPEDYPTESVTHPPGLNCYLSSRSYRRGSPGGISPWHAHNRDHPEP